VQKLAKEGEIRTTAVGARRRYLKAEIARLGQLEWRG